jgi:hypothetical protein
MIDTALQNKALDKKTGDAVKNYIADYVAMKDKGLVMQQELQGGKIGRAGAQGFLSITQQIPDGATPDSKTAKRKLHDLQETQDELATQYPDSYGNFTKEPVYNPETTTTTGEPVKNTVENNKGAGVENNVPVKGDIYVDPNTHHRIQYQGGTDWLDVATGQPFVPKKKQ